MGGVKNSDGILCIRAFGIGNPSRCVGIPIKISGKGRRIRLKGVFFFDAGVLGENLVDYDSPRASTGLGIRFALQPAIVAIDFAFPIADQSDDETQFVHFSFTSAF